MFTFFSWKRKAYTEKLWLLFTAVFCACSLQESKHWWLPLLTNFRNWGTRKCLFRPAFAPLCSYLGCQCVLGYVKHIIVGLSNLYHQHDAFSRTRDTQVQLYQSQWHISRVERPGNIRRGVGWGPRSERHKNRPLRGLMSIVNFPAERSQGWSHGSLRLSSVQLTFIKHKSADTNSSAVDFLTGVLLLCNLRQLAQESLLQATRFGLLYSASAGNRPHTLVPFWQSSMEGAPYYQTVMMTDYDPGVVISSFFYISIDRNKQPAIEFYKWLQVNRMRFRTSDARWHVLELSIKSLDLMSPRCLEDSTSFSY